MKGRTVRHDPEEGRRLDLLQVGTIAEHPPRSSTEAVRILARELGWFFTSYLVCDDRGPIAHCLEDLADFAEDQGWIYQNPSSFGFGVNWSRVPRPATVAADRARWSLDDSASVALVGAPPDALSGESPESYAGDNPTD